MQTSAGTFVPRAVGGGIRVYRRLLEPGTSGTGYTGLMSSSLNKTQESQTPYEQAFELVDVLIASAQSAVHMICESITCRISGVSEKTKKQAINPDLLVPKIWMYHWF